MTSSLNITTTTTTVKTTTTTTASTTTVTTTTTTSTITTRTTILLRLVLLLLLLLFLELPQPELLPTLLLQQHLLRLTTPRTSTNSNTLIPLLSRKCCSAQYMSDINVIHGSILPFRVKLDTSEFSIEFSAEG